jgi:hypothetical protein
MTQGGHLPCVLRTPHPQEGARWTRAVEGQVAALLKREEEKEYAE